ALDPVRCGGYLCPGCLVGGGRLLFAHPLVALAACTPTTVVRSARIVAESGSGLCRWRGLRRRCGGQEGEIGVRGFRGVVVAVAALNRLDLADTHRVRTVDLLDGAAQDLEEHVAPRLGKVMGWRVLTLDIDLETHHDAFFHGFLPAGNHWAAPQRSPV